MRRRFVLGTALAATLAVVVVGAPASAQQHHRPLNRDSAQVAIRGYDPVAYFTDGRPVQGRAEFEYVWEGARWRFASAEHRALFIADPERYAPEFGGFCAMAMARLGRPVEADPEVWTIVEGRLYLTFDVDGRSRFLGALPANQPAAQRNYLALPRH